MCTLFKKNSEYFFKSVLNKVSKEYYTFSVFVEPKLSFMFLGISDGRHSYRYTNKNGADIDREN